LIAAQLLLIALLYVLLWRSHIYFLILVPNVICDPICHRAVGDAFDLVRFAWRCLSGLRSWINIAHF
jgi:O-antigen ligase